MRVAVDVAPLIQTAAGTARWIDGLLEGLAARPGIEVRRLSFGGPGRVQRLVRDVAWYPLGLPRAAAREGADVLHCTIYRGPLRSRVPHVVTVHDLAVLRHPEAFNAWTRLYARTLLRATVRAARRVVVVSDFTARDVERLCGVPGERIDVVPNAVAPVFAPEGHAAAGDYLLAVGTLEPRKNLPRAVAAARLLGAELRIVGERGWGGVEVDGPGVRWLGRVPDDELATLYRGARCLLYPSLYEGFGIPVVEAMACGTPVVTSRGTATEDVAGGAAVLVDPTDVRAIAAGVEEALAGAERLGALGLERATRFTRAAVAEAAIASYRRAAA